MQPFNDLNIFFLPNCPFVLFFQENRMISRYKPIDQSAKSTCVFPGWTPTFASQISNFLDVRTVVLVPFQELPTNFHLEGPILYSRVGSNEAGTGER